MAGHSPAFQWHYGPVAPYCCEMMRSNIEKVCEQHDHAEDCPDRLGTFVPKFNEFGLPVHDGGSSYVIIEYCLWCGRKLPESACGRWFEELERRGVDPATDAVPREFLDATWLGESQG